MVVMDALRYYKLTDGQVAHLMLCLREHEKAIRDEMGLTLKNAKDSEQLQNLSLPYFNALGRLDTLRQSLNSPENMRFSDDR